MGITSDNIYLMFKLSTQSDRFTSHRTLSDTENTYRVDVPGVGSSDWISQGDYDALKTSAGVSYVAFNNAAADLFGSFWSDVTASNRVGLRSVLENVAGSVSFRLHRGNESIDLTSGCDDLATLAAASIVSFSVFDTAALSAFSEWNDNDMTLARRQSFRSAFIDL